jgi:hypothetical protein
LDNVRLSSAITPRLLNPLYTNGQFSLTLQSEPGSVVDILASTNPALPRTSWTPVGTVTNTTGTTTVPDSFTGFTHRFYCARQLH